MQIQTMSIVVGNSSCNAKCPFCIAKTTPEIQKCDEVNWRNFDIACKLADKSGTTTALMTGKGEPTLFPSQIGAYLEAMNKNNCFPIRELQTNGIALAKEGSIDLYLKSWYEAGLTTICLSAVHYVQALNAEIYGPNYPDIKELVAKLRGFGYTVRLSIMILKGYIDSEGEIRKLVNYCQRNNIKQLTLRPITSPSLNDFQGNKKIYNWIQDNAIDGGVWYGMKDHISDVGNSVIKLSHGAEVFDYEGQNVCVATCITTNKSTEKMRQIIFHPDGTVGFDWKYSGAILL